MIAPQMAEAIKKERRKAGLTIEQLADRVHSTYTTLWRLENNQAKVTLEWVEKLADALGCSMADLVPQLRAQPETASVSAYVGPDERTYHLEAATALNVPAPAPGLLGILVRGEGLWPRYEEGDILFYPAPTQPLDAYLDRECIVMTKAGIGYIKRLCRGTGLGSFRLTSHRLREQDNVEIAWAAPITYVTRAATNQ